MALREDGFFRPDRGGEISPRRGVILRDPEDDVADDRSELDERAADLEEEEDAPFLRAPRRIPVRRGAVTKRTASRIKIVAIAAAILVGIGATAGGLYAYASASWRFRMDSSDNLEIGGIQNVTRAQVMEVYGADIGRNVFFIPLAERRKKLEEIPWVESATVMRLLPNRIRVQITERTPVAFVRIGSKVSLIDGNGVVMEMPTHAGQRYSFPVIVGMEDSEPLSTRAARMKIYSRLIGDLDSTGAHYSQALSEVELNDPEDVKATVADAQGAVLLHLGAGDFLSRYKIYLEHAQEWRQQYHKLDSVDLRYDRQVIVNPDSRSIQPEAQPAAPKKSAAKPKAGRH